MLISSHFVRPFLILLLLGLGGCASLPKDAGDDAVRLSLAIETLSPMVDPLEARRVAELLTRESLRLAETYRSVGPAWLQNVLVNSGFRERGLCYHWVNDLLTALESDEYRSLVFYRGGYAVGTFKEHNTLVIAPYGSSFEEGLVVDAWRYQGRLHWVRVVGDELDWEELLPASINP